METGTKIGLSAAGLLLAGGSYWLVITNLKNKKGKIGLKTYPNIAKGEIFIELTVLNPDKSVFRMSEPHASVFKNQEDLKANIPIIYSEISSRMHVVADNEQERSFLVKVGTLPQIISKLGTQKSIIIKTEFKVDDKSYFKIDEIKLVDSNNIALIIRK